MTMKLLLGAAVIAFVATPVLAATATTGMSSQADALKLTSAQRHDIYQDVRKQKTSETAPAGFTAKVGEAVPSSIKINPLPASATKQVPAVKSYDFAMLNHKVLLVNPNSKKIVDIVTQ